MNQDTLFTIESSIEFRFTNSDIRDNSYNSFMPEIQKLHTKRSKIVIEKKNKTNLLFKIESNDITAFRASINEIVSFGKIIDSTISLTEIS